MPAAIGGAIVALLGTVGAALPAGAASVIGSVVLAGAAFAVNLLLAPRPRSPESDDLKRSEESKEGPGRFAFGRVRVGSVKHFGNTKGYEIFQLNSHYFGPASATEEFYYDGRSIVVEQNGNVSSPPFARPGGSYITIQTAPGDGTETAWPDLKTAFPDQWTDNHRLRGIAQSLATFTNPGTGDEKFQRLYTGGIKPVERLDRAGEFYDPRDGLTRWSMNSVLICLHYRLLRPGVSLANFDTADLATVANQADELVTTLDGTAPRSQLSGGGEGEITTEFVMDLMESAGLEEVRLSSGLLTFRFIEDYPDAEVILNAEHVIQTQLQLGPDGARRPNVCRVKYFSPERQYSVAEIPLQTFGGTNGTYDGPAWARIQSEIDTYGEQEKTYDLKFCPNAAQAQRIARRLFHMDRAVTGALQANFAGLACWGAFTADLPVVDVASDGGPEAVRARIATPRANDANGTCEIGFAVIPDILTTAWNPAADERPPPPVLEVSQFEADLPQPAAPSSARAVQYPSGGWEIRVAFSPVAGATIAEASYRTYTGGLPDLWAGMNEVGLTLAYDNGNLLGQQADFRVRMFDDDEGGSYFSELLEVASVVEATGAPSAPILSVTGPEGGNFTVRVTAPNDIRVVAVRLEITFEVPETVELQPSGFFQRTIAERSADMTFSAIAIGSDGSESFATSYFYDAPDP